MIFFIILSLYVCSILQILCLTHKHTLHHCWVDDCSDWMCLNLKQITYDLSHSTRSAAVLHIFIPLFMSNRLKIVLTPVPNARNFLSAIFIFDFIVASIWSWIFQWFERSGNIQCDDDTMPKMWNNNTEKSTRKLTIRIEEKRRCKRKEKEKGTRTWKKVFRYFCYSTRKQHRVFFLILFMPLNCIHFTKFIVLISIAFRFARSSIIFLANICTVSIH